MLRRIIGGALSPRHTNMNPEMAYFIRPCSLPQNPAFSPAKGASRAANLGSQAFDIVHVFSDDRHRGGGKTEFSPCFQGAAGNCRGDELGGAQPLRNLRCRYLEADQRRFTGAVSSEQSDLFASSDRELYVAQHADCADHSNTRNLRASRISHKPNTVKIASANAVYNGSP